MKEGISSVNYYENAEPDVKNNFMTNKYIVDEISNKHVNHNPNNLNLNTNAFYTDFKQSLKFEKQPPNNNPTD